MAKKQRYTVQYAEPCPVCGYTFGHAVTCAAWQAANAGKELMPAGTRARIEELEAQNAANLRTIAALSSEVSDLHAERDKAWASRDWWADKSIEGAERADLANNKSEQLQADYNAAMVLAGKLYALVISGAGGDSDEARQANELIGAVRRVT